MRSFNSFLLTAIAASLLLLGSSCSPSTANTNNSNTAESENQPVSVKTAVATVEEIPTYFEATGTLASDAESNVAPTIGGKISEVRFDVGSYVKKGDVLVKLDAADAEIRYRQSLAQLEQAKKAVLQAEAGVDQAVANLRQTQVRLGVRDGETFEINDFSQVISVTAQLKLAEAELRRYTNLLESGDVSRSTYDLKRSQRDSLLGQLAEARSNAAVAIRAINTADAGVKSAQTQVANAKAAVVTAETQVAQAKKTIADNTIVSPISGYVSERNADPGEYISPNQPNAKLATIVRTAVLRLKIDIPEQSLGKVSIGQSVSAQVSAYPDRKFAGTIVRKFPSLNSQSRTLTVEAEVENVGGLLKPGQFATVRITQSKPAPAVMIPSSAVRTEGETNIVYVIKDGIANERLVQVGLLEGGLIEIKTGVQENEVVAVDNLDKLGDGVIVSQSSK
jgi:RND family efflux transporter MFP subunit